MARHMHTILGGIDDEAWKKSCDFISAYYYHTNSSSFTFYQLSSCIKEEVIATRVLNDYPLQRKK